MDASVGGLRSVLRNVDYGVMMVVAMMKEVTNIRKLVYSSMVDVN